MIKLVNVNKYFGDLHVLKDVNLEVAEGEKLVIIGPSGSGKSTTVRCMNFLEEPTSGEVWIDGTLLTNKNKTQLNRTTMSHGVPAVQPLSPQNRAPEPDPGAYQAPP